MLVSCWMVLKGSKNAISEFFVKGARLKTEGVEKRVGATAFDGIEFRTLHQFFAKAMPARWRDHGKYSDA